MAILIEVKVQVNEIRIYSLNYKMLQLLVRVKWVSIFLFAIIHILIGLALIYFYGKLPKALNLFVSVFLIISLLYWGTVLINSLLN